MEKILELEAWNLTEDSLSSLNNQAAIRIHLPYPDYRSVIDYPPDERRKIIAKKLREAFKEFKVILKNAPGDRNTLSDQAKE